MWEGTARSGATGLGCIVITCSFVGRWGVWRLQGGAGLPNGCAAGTVRAEVVGQQADDKAAEWDWRAGVQRRPQRVFGWRGHAERVVVTFRGSSAVWRVCGIGRRVRIGERGSGHYVDCLVLLQLCCRLSSRGFGAVAQSHWCAPRCALEVGGWVAGVHQGGAEEVSLWCSQGRSRGCGGTVVCRRGQRLVARRCCGANGNSSARELVVAAAQIAGVVRRGVIYPWLGDCMRCVFGKPRAALSYSRT